MAIIFATMVPHPPIIIPQIGKGEETPVKKTMDSYKKVAEDIFSFNPDTIIITTPHSVMYGDYFHVSPGKHTGGNFSEFGAPEVNFNVDYDSELINLLSEITSKNKIPAGVLGERDSSLDHGTMVPLYFIEKAYGDKKLPPIVRIGLSGLSLKDHYMLGQSIVKTAQKLNRRVVFVASGDLSHKLKEDGPYGFAKEGPEYDEKIMDIMGNGDFGKLFEFPTEFLETAAECGHRSFMVMAGALDGKSISAKKLSYQGNFGVGYGICTFVPGREDTEREFLRIYEEKKKTKLNGARKKESHYTALARKTVESYVRYGKVITAPKNLPTEFLNSRAGAFVTLKKDGMLRGCIGTISPTYDNIAEEIINNAVSASSEDTRFNPVMENELDDIVYSVDILGESEKITSKSDLDVIKYGIIVSDGNRRGLLLPNIEGVKDVGYQISIALEKAGIGANENYSIERFEVKRYY